MIARPTKEVVAEQTAIEMLANIEQRKARNLVAANKRFMKSIAELPYGAWRSKVLRRMKKDLNAYGKDMLRIVLAAPYEINKKDSFDLANKGRSASKDITLLTKTTGNKPEANIKKLLSDANSILATQMTRYRTQNQSNNQIADSVMGSAAQNYKNGDLSPYINASRAQTNTNIKAGTEDIRDERRKDEDGAIGYLWVSTLDGVTSSTCMGLNGKEFYYGTSGFKPLPPIHPNCRSTTEPIFEDEPVPEIETFNEWLKANPEEVEEALGPGQFDNLKIPGKGGGLRIERFTDARFKPLTIPALEDQLK